VNDWLSRWAVQYWILSGRWNYRHEQYAQALGYFERAIRAGSSSGAIFAHVGYCLAELKRYDEAVEAYHKALQRSRQYPEIHAHLGRIYSELNRRQEAYDSLHRAFRSKPQLQEHAYWLQILGNVCLNLERWDEARASFEKILASKPGTEDVWLGLGIALTNLNRQPEAVDAFRKSVQASPNSAKAWHWLGWTFAQWVVTLMR
jgi:tetratricopeptide (TPR) repeat protein